MEVPYQASIVFVIIFDPANLATFRRLNPNYQFPIPVQSTFEQEAFQCQMHPGDYPYEPPVPYQPIMIPQYTPTGQLMVPGFGNGSPMPSMLRSPYVTHRYALPGTLVQSQKATGTAGNADMSEEDLLLTSTVIFRFSLADKVWCKVHLAPSLSHHLTHTNSGI